jgi:Flp pilus assembly protein TadG
MGVEQEHLRILHIGPIATGRRRRQGGNQLVEVSLIFLPLFAILLALFDFSLALFLRATMQNAVREGVRYAVTYQTASGLCQDASIKATVKTAAVGFLSATADESKIKVRFYDPSNLGVEVTGSNSNAPGNVVEIAVEGYTWSWIAPLWRTASPFNINVYAADRMEGLAGGVSPPCR